jgi:transcriptional regulator with XRE-family HTH domain
MEVMIMLTMPRRSRLKLPPIPFTTEESMGERLARLRKERGFTQVELATKIGIVQSLMTSYECDRLRMHPEMVVRFALALAVSSDALLGVPSKKALRDSTDATALSLKLVKRLQKIERLPATQQKALLHTIDVFLRGSAHEERHSN